MLDEKIRGLSRKKATTNLESFCWALETKSRRMQLQQQFRYKNALFDIRNKQQRWLWRYASLTNLNQLLYTGNKIILFSFSEFSVGATIKTFFMVMTMIVNGKVLDSIRVYVPMCKDERYFAWLKKELRLKHQHMLLNGQGEPSFLLSRPEKK